jgi:hypothetical protein
MGWFVGASAVLQVALAAWAIKIAVNAHGVSEQAALTAEREHRRADARYRLMCLHDCLNAVRELWVAKRTMQADEHFEKQRWLKSMLAVAGARHELPLTVTLSEMPRNTRRDVFGDACISARDELETLIEHDADRIYAGERLRNP